MLDKLFRTFFIASIFFGVILGNQADHLLLNRITISPTQAEMVSIFNPTTDIINLSNYYLSDAEKSSTNKHYYNLPLESDYFSGSVSDFFIRFPNINIEPNDTMFIALHDSTTFHNYYNFPADLSLWNDSLAYTDDNYPFNSSIIREIWVLILFMVLIGLDPVLFTNSRRQKHFNKVLRNFFILRLRQ